MDFAPWAEELSRWGRRRGANVVLVDTIGSTNRLGLDILRRVPEAELVGWIFALHQGRGEGRYGRSWSSPRGAGVYASRMLHLPSASVSLLPLAVGVGLCAGLGAAGYPCRLKWPNDLLLGGAKIGGILLHGRIAAARAAVVAGFGVNHGHRREDLPHPDTTSLRLTSAGEPPPLAELSWRLADALEAELVLWGEEEDWSAERLVARYAERLAHAPGDFLTVTAGDEVVRGSFAGLATDGRLRLRTADGERLMTAGDVEEAAG